MSFFIQRGGEGNCPICGNAIGATEVVIVQATFQAKGEQEARVTRKYGHLACAAQVKPKQAYSALVSRESEAALVKAVLPDIAEINARLADDVRAARSIPLAGDPRTEELLAELEASPGDRALYTVLADHLLQRGDVRGELIVLDLNGATDPVAVARRGTLRAALGPEGIEQRRAWGFGFLKTLELHDTRGSLAEHAAAVRHPACRLLDTLLIIGDRSRGEIEVPFDLLPRSLRTLYLGIAHAPLDLAHLPYLGRVTTPRVVAHPTLRRLDLVDPTTATIVACAARLPSTTQLSLTSWLAVGFIDALASTGWLTRLSHFEIHGLQIGDSEVRQLETAFATRKLEALTIMRCLNETYRQRLQALCKTLTFEPRLHR